jgi:hypothetical protein
VNPESDNRLRAGELPHLEIIPIDQIVLHEEPDAERSSLLEITIEKEGILKNPPVVARYQGGGQSILLDGANRITALKNLDIGDVLVQQVDLFDPDLLLLHWHHAVESIDKNEFLDKLDSLDEVKIERQDQDSISGDNDISKLCEIQFVDKSVYKFTANNDLLENVDSLKQIVEIYKRSENMDRVSYTNLDHLKTHYPEFTAIVCFRTFTREELIQIIEHNKTLPCGITRIILPKRALRLNVPLDILRFDSPVSEKNHWLQQRLKLQVKNKSIRFYYESTFVFDE